jgi:hypothetical protein
MAGANSKIRVKSIALPVEHGGWGFLFEPILLGLLVSPSVAGAWIALTAVAAFLLKRPLRLFLMGKGPLSGMTRRRAAMYVSIGYGLIVAGGLWFAISLTGIHVVLPLAVLSPLVVVYLWFDSGKPSRKLAPELAGPTGLAGVAPAIALCAGATQPYAWALWVILLARTIPSILYVRARLRLDRGSDTNRAPVIGWHLGFLVVVGTLVAEGLAPRLALMGLLILLVRAAHGLSSRRGMVRVTRIGFMEIAYGLIYVFVTTLGYRSGV